MRVILERLPDFYAAHGFYNRFFHRFELALLDIYTRSGGTILPRIECGSNGSTACKFLNIGIIEQNMNVVIDPGETKTLKVKLTKTGVFPFYCTNFCSALHQEMQGYLTVKPAPVAETAAK